MTAWSASRRVLDLGVAEDMTVTDAKHVRITNIVAILGAVMVLQWIPLNFMVLEVFVALESLVVGFGLLLALPLNHFGYHRAAAVMLLIAAQAQLAWSVWMFGVASGVLFYYMLTVFLPYLVFRTQYKRMAHGFALIGLVALIGFTVFQERFPAQVINIAPRYQEIINTAVAAGALLLMAAAFRNLVDGTERALQRERERADLLLLNVLPPSVAERLKLAPERGIADRYDEVTVLFADIVGFTPLSARLSATKTVELLNEVFTAFDAMCDRAGIEKVRTIGDGYMAVAGAPLPRSDHAEAMTRVAIEMREYMASNPLDEPLQVRIGINSGAAVAGVVGTARFHYDLWGDAVNVAARMESLGEPGRIHVAPATWERIHDQFDCESRGKIEVKGKGAMETWFVS
ncbi:MAG: adenylate/guanylate cyclase domain-containing protein [Gammaproteobacteria bacterium]|nr:adenylate/guanylate cyclase domain-containing protein [Gammaproteobacteria bacterium]